MHQTRRHDPRAAKRRDIARSVLPSSSRKGARDALQGLRRADRRATAMALRSLRDHRPGAVCCGADAGAPDVADTARPVPGEARDDVCPVCELALPGYPLGEHGYAVNRRRFYDKVAPLIRWATAEVEGMAPDAARVRLTSVLPDGLIGSHALSHLEGTVLPTPLSWFDLLPYPEDDLRDLHPVVRSVGSWSLETGNHRLLNRLVRKYLCDDPGPARGQSGDRRPSSDCEGMPQARPLLGIHDLERWADDVAAVAMRRPTATHEPGLRRWSWSRGLTRLLADVADLGWRDGCPDTDARRSAAAG